MASAAEKACQRQYPMTCRAVLQGYVAGQPDGQEDRLLSIPTASCTNLQNGTFLLGTALPGVDVRVCDLNGSILPPDVPGHLFLTGFYEADERADTGLRALYSWDGVLTLLTSSVSETLTLVSDLRFVAVTHRALAGQCSFPDF